MSEASADGRSLSQTAFELKRILKSQPQVCVICRFVTTSIEHRIESLFYENVNDPPTRDAIRTAGGFCRYHAHFIAKQADALGTAIILRDVLTHELRALEAGNYDRPAAPSNGLARFFDRGREINWEREVKCRPCPLCDAEETMTQRAIDSMLAGLEDQEFADLFATSDGLCLAHFELAFDRADADKRWNSLLNAEKRALQRLTDQLAELARKHDYRFQHEPKGEEMRSWRRALNISSSWLEK